VSVPVKRCATNSVTCSLRGYYRKNSSKLEIFKVLQEPGRNDSDEGGVSLSVITWMNEINDCCCSDLWPQTSAASLDKLKSCTRSTLHSPFSVGDVVSGTVPFQQTGSIKKHPHGFCGKA